VNENDFYEVIGVAPTATLQEIKERFRFLSHAYHPDKFATEAQRRSAEHEFKRINRAYQVISDPIRRARYDDSRSHSSQSSSHNRSTHARTSANEPSVTEATPKRVSRAFLRRRIALIALVISALWTIFRVWHPPVLTLSAPGKEIKLSSSAWTAMQNPEDYAKNFEARRTAKNEIFSVPSPKPKSLTDSFGFPKEYQG
jgi:curved DNA-binding protein CbpA